MASRQPAVVAAAAAPSAAVWQLLLAARRVAASLGERDQATLSVRQDGQVRAEAVADSIATIQFREGRWHRLTGDAGGDLLDLYLPIAAASAARPLVVAHLGQSLDGHIATASGDSNYVTGAGNLDHLHRLRALVDAIVVGAGTAASDNPQLTTRRVPGPNPVRVVIDPALRLQPGLSLFARADQADSRTLILHDAGHRPASESAPGAAAGNEDSPVERIAIPGTRDGLDLPAALAALRARGLHSIFVEGGGVTVSAFVEAGLVDRLQLAIAPLLTGAGRPALTLPARNAMADCLRPASRVFRMGEDILFDCDLRAEPAPDGVASSSDLLQRIL